MPICSVGPSWGFTMILLCFATMCACFFGYLMNILYQQKTPYSIHAIVFDFTLILINLVFLGLGICSDPGVSPSIYLRYTKLKYGQNKGNFQKDKNLNANSNSTIEKANEIEMSNADKFQQKSQLQNSSNEYQTTDTSQDSNKELDDIENQNNIRQRKNNNQGDKEEDEEDSDPDLYGSHPEEFSKNYRPKILKVNGKTVVFCKKCNVTVELDMDHCEDCQVCVSGIDHHCVFFSKCIGKGNICYFWTSIAMMVTNFFLISLSVIIFNKRNKHLFPDN